MIIKINSIRGSKRGKEEGAIYENAKTAVRMGAKLPKP
jgi:hypothetical protein